MKTFFLITLMISHALSAEANKIKRSVRIEWQKIEQAQNYEVEITDALEKKMTQKIVQENQLQFELSPGEYKFRLRGIDRRGVLGPWSPFEPLSVRVGAVKLLQPPNNWEHVNDNDYSMKINFKWSAASGADKYFFQLRTLNNNLVIEQQLKETEFSFDLPVGESYLWSVASLSGTQKSEKNERSFTILAKNYAKPKIFQPKNKFVRQLEWQLDPSADSVDFVILYLEPDKQIWITRHQEFDFSAKTFLFPLSWQGGNYRIELLAKKNQKPISEKSILEFDVLKGDRSIAAENKAIVAELFQRQKVRGYFVNYILSDISYQSKSPSLNSINSFNALTGTLSAGAEALFNQKYGARALLSLGGMLINNENFVLKKGELSALYRKQATDISDIRLFSGLFYNEFPEVHISLSSITNQIQISSVYGINIGFEYWRSLFGYYGIKLMSHYNLGIAGKSNLDGQFKSSDEFTMCVSGSYRLSSSDIYSIGYKYKAENYLLKENTSDQNKTIKLNGHYFYFDYQWELE